MKYRLQRKQFPRILVNYILSIPFMYGMVIPLIILDIGLEIFHRVCFRLCHIPYVKRSQYIKIDRQKLSYLKWFEKLNCAYCGYANGLLQYAVAIGAETEKYWCGIMHAKYKDFKPPKHHKDFLPYGDEQAFRDFVKDEDAK